MTKETIITHPGSAHFDEFFAISLILAVHAEKEFEIFRREPTQEELANPDIWVVDIGGRLEPDLKNFDHHQGIDVRASFVIVSEYLGLSEKLEIFDWFDYKDQIDRFGPVKVGRNLGTEKLLMTYSPFEEWYVTYFAEQPNTCLPLMKLFGEHIIKEADTLFCGIEFWKNADTYTIKNKTVKVGFTEDSTGARELAAKMKNPFAVTVSYDRRGDGWTLKRYNDDPDVDFSKIIDHKDIKFAHAGGFIAKTLTKIPFEEVLLLVELAICKK